MARWTPELYVLEIDGGCRLCLGSYAHGDGRTLQEAADRLVERLLVLAKGVFTGASFRWSGRFGARDLAYLDFLYELHELAESGADVRARVLGP